MSSSPGHANLKDLMEETDDRGASQGNIVKLTPLRINPSLRATSSGRVTPRHSPSFHTSHFSRTPRGEPKIHAAPLRWIRSKSLLPWLVMISVWSYVGFHIQSKWVHQENKEKFPGYKIRPISERDTNGGISDEVPGQRLDAKKDENNLLTGTLSKALAEGGSLKNPNIISVNVSKNKKPAIPKANLSRLTKKKVKKIPILQNNDNNKSSDIVSETMELNEGTQVHNNSIMYTAYGTPKRNTSYGHVVGPFGKIEDSILEWNPKKRSGACDRKSLFGQAVWGRSFILIFHELSITGAPISMMELASELLSCGGTVSVVALSRKGGLMGELLRRGIKVLKDKSNLSCKIASKADLVIAGSAVCASWIEQYLLQYRSGWSQIIWWIMENRRPYFDRSKHMLPKVKMLMFLSESQSHQWLSWCKEESIQLKFTPLLVPLSVNEELAFAAGIPSSLNTPSFTVEKMLEKRCLLRNAIRRELGLSNNDMLVMTLSSINPGKGQFLLLQSALLLSNKLSGTDDKENGSTARQNFPIPTDGNADLPIDKRTNARALFHSVEQYNQSSDVSVRPRWVGDNFPDPNSSSLSYSLYENVQSRDRKHWSRQLLSLKMGKATGALKVLIGSIGCKSNKVVYVKAMLKFLSRHPQLAKAMLWTPATTRVTSLYAAADVYVINAQGLGETFGRVTIEAMAFGLPILGTDAGGTREIVEHNVTGLLHPLGQNGVQVLADNLEFLLHNPSVRDAMGAKGRKKIQQLFLKNHMYQKFAEVLQKCMKVK